MPSEMKKRQLIFVYNADSGLFNSLSDFAHKILSPATYNCQLCALTYGNFTMNTEWKNFIKTMAVEVVFLHKDEFISRYGDNPAGYPSAYLHEEESLKSVISQIDIEQCASLEELKQLVSTKAG